MCGKKLKPIETLMKCSLCNQDVCMKHIYSDSHHCVNPKLAPINKPELVKVVADKMENRL
jgi:hypothetical protein